MVRSDNPLEIRLTVGRPVPGIVFEIADDGETMAMVLNIMRRYHNRTKVMGEVADSDGRFHAGDVGLIVSQRRLMITAQKKRRFVSS